MSQPNSQNKKSRTFSQTKKKHNENSQKGFRKKKNHKQIVQTNSHGDFVTEFAKK